MDTKKYEDLSIGELSKMGRNGDGHAAFMLGWRYLHGKKIALSLAKAQEWFERGKDDCPLCLFATAFDKDGELIDGSDAIFGSALKGVREYAEKGNKFAQFYLGQYFLFGIGGIAVDYKKAYGYLTKAYKQGHAGACSLKAWFYEYGEIVGRNIEQAITLHRRAAEFDGYAPSQRWLGEYYLKERNFKEAKKHLEKAAKQNDMIAKMTLEKLPLLKEWAKAGDQAKEDFITFSETKEKYDKIVLQSEEFKTQNVDKMEGTVIASMNKKLDGLLVELGETNKIMAELNTRSDQRFVRMKKLEETINDINKKYS